MVESDRLMQVKLVLFGPAGADHALSGWVCRAMRTIGSLSMAGSPRDESKAKYELSDLFILGGKTRLAKALHLRATQSGRQALVLCAPDADRAPLQKYYADEVIVSGLSPSAPVVSVVVCAFGLVHPAAPNAEVHWSALMSECRYLSTLLAAHPGRVHVVLVSTVIALLPPRERAYYAAFKNMAEALVAAATRGGSDALFSVLYPGRLVEARGAHGLASRLATPYGQLADLLLEITRSGRPTQRVVGMDARLWLAARALRLLVGMPRRSLPETPLAERDGLPHANDP